MDAMRRLRSPLSSWPVVVPWAALLAAAITGCDGSVEVRPDPAGAEDRATETFVFAGGAGSGARVTRTVAPDGTEALHGETLLRLGKHARERIVEDVTINPCGRLVHAEITVARDHDPTPEARVSLDPPSGRVWTATVGGAGESRAAKDAPWVYAPEVQGRPVPTPVAAWVTLRASEASRRMRLVQIGQRGGGLLPRRQLAIPTELGTTVVVGDDGCDVDETFVDRVRMLGLGLDLVRVPDRDEAVI
jgi:hypothetical protein